jgi:hypothetical protein
VRPRMDLWALLAVLVLPTASRAGGTVGLDEADRLLRQRPSLRRFLMSSLELENTVMAAVRLGPHFEHLGGARVGPYLLEGRPKGSKDGEPLEVVLCTHVRFLDAEGKVPAEESEATRVEERLTVVMIREAHSQPAVPSCPE